MPGRRHYKQARPSKLELTHVANSAAIIGHRWLIPDDPSVAHRERERENGESDRDDARDGFEILERIINQGKLCVSRIILLNTIIH